MNTESINSPKSPQDSHFEDGLPPKYLLKLKGLQLNSKSITSQQLQDVNSIFSKLCSLTDPLLLKNILSTNFLPSIQSYSVEKEILKFTQPTCRELCRPFGGEYIFSSLIKVLLMHGEVYTRETNKTPVTSLVFNSLFIIKRLISYFLEHLSFDDFINQFEDPTDQEFANIKPHKDNFYGFNTASKNKKQALLFVKWLLKVLTYLDLSLPGSNELYQECLCTYVILLSKETRSLAFDSDKSFEAKYFYELPLDHKFMFLSRLALRLIGNFFDSLLPEPRTGMISGALSYIFSPTTLPTTIPYQSLQVFFLLALHKQEGSNPFFGALSNYFSLTKGVSLKDKIPSPDLIFTAILPLLEDDTVTLLFYSLIVYNVSFREFILSLTDPGQLVIPLVKIVYETIIRSENQYQMYLLSSTLILCTESEIFVKNMEQTNISPFSWFDGRLFQRLPLSEFVLHVLFKVITLTLTEPRNQFVYSTMTSVLINMASYVTKLHPSTVQKFFSLFDLINKKRIKLGQSLEREREAKLIGISVYEELLFLMMEFMAVNIKSHVHGSTELIYGLLQHKEIFDQFCLHPSLGRLSSAILQVIDHFSTSIANANLSVQPTALELAGIISSVALKWSPEPFKELSPRIFTYAPATESNSFLKSYLWPAVYSRFPLNLNSEPINLLTSKAWDC